MCVRVLPLWTMTKTVALGSALQDMAAMMDELLAGAAAASRLSDRRSLWAAVRLVAARLAREQAAEHAAQQGTERHGGQQQQVPDAPVLDFGELRRLADMELQEKQQGQQGQLPGAVRVAGGALLLASPDSLWGARGHKEQGVATGLDGDGDLVPQSARPSLAGTMRLVSTWRCCLRSFPQDGTPTARPVKHACLSC